MLRRLALPLALCLGHSLTAHAQTRPETIRGRVTSDSGAAIVGATVSATMAPDRTFQQATTDSSGRFAIHFAAGTGDYLIHVSALGYKAVRKRLTRVPGDTSLVIDLKLSPDVAKLAAVKVTASKPRPDRDDSGSGTGSSEKQREGVFASVAPGDEGNLAAIANAIPGASMRGGGLSVLGLDGSQSNATLNGMAFGGAGLPRDARTQVRVTTSTYDPSRGGFSGGQTAVELSPGGSISSRTAHLTGDATLLQAPSTVGDQLGQRFASLNGSIGGSGELVEDVWYYNSALQLSRRMSDAPSLLSAGTEALTAAGIAPDSVLRLTQLLGAARVPTGLASIPSDAISQTASFAARLDHTPYKPGGRDPSLTTWNVNVFGNVADDQAQGFNPSSIATHGGRRTSLFAGTQLDYSKFFGDVLNDTRMGLSVSNDHGTPYLSLPGGTVLLSSTLPDGGAAISGLTFGGNGGADYSRRSWTWETINETQWYTKGAPHRVKFTAQSRLDGYSHSAPEDLLGAF
ncbi:MAG TPA: carboxypeptidase-like regulatory domain-containing protein, partial [Gemmatimonadaceae bacterium]|nr:carboxypeptidase-like regulatory domain-containing protein [Gemmatimonadaceae bacterium]